MKLANRIFAFGVAIIIVMLSLLSCTENGIESGDIPKIKPTIGSLRIEGASEIELELSETRVLIANVPEAAKEFLEWSCEGDAVSVDSRGVVIAEKLGEAVVRVVYGALSDSVKIKVVLEKSGSGDGSGGVTDPDGGDGGTGGGATPDGGDDTEDKEFGSEYPCISVSEALALAEGYTSDASEEKFYIAARVRLIESASSGEMYVFDESGEIYVYKCTYVGGLTLAEAEIAEGDLVVIEGTLRNYKGTLEVQTGVIVLADKADGSGDAGGDVGGDSGDGGDGTGSGGVTDPDGGDGGTGGGSGDSSGDTGDLDFSSDPYASMTKSEFYANYKPAVCYKDSYYRNLHKFMSGTLTVPDAAPEVSDHQPTVDGKYVKNTVTVFLDDGNTYVVYDAFGVEAFRVYRGGGYITLEEVAAHMYAFGTIPANHSSSKSTKPTSSEWGEYLRVNHSKFSGDTSKYKYEPVLPDISGCGGSKIYYEMDIGTTGTDTGGGYAVRIYNNGTSIVRGAARIVYTWKDDNRNGNIDAELGEVYVFYTYNHYNDFQEYLNYKGGWGEMFGNITGGGTLSSNSNYNPTPYVPVAFGAISVQGAAEVGIIFVPIFSDKRA